MEDGKTFISAPNMQLNFLNNVCGHLKELMGRGFDGVICYRQQKNECLGPLIYILFIVLRDSFF